MDAAPHTFGLMNLRCVAVESSESSTVPALPCLEDRQEWFLECFDPHLTEISSVKTELSRENRHQTFGDFSASSLISLDEATSSSTL